MDYIVIEGVPPYDGRFEFDLDGRPLNTREWGWIKRWSGFTMLTVSEGWTEHDPELVTTFAVIALVRAGKADKAQGGQVFEQMSEIPFGVGKAITMEFGDEEKVEDDAGPPPRSSPSNGEGSSLSSKPSSATSPPIPNRSGTVASVSSTSPPPRSAS